jgi:hypothetical protein
MNKLIKCNYYGILNYVIKNNNDILNEMNEMNEMNEQKNNMNEMNE